MVEQEAVNFEVVGSSPIRGAIFFDPKPPFLLHFSAFYAKIWTTDGFFVAQKLLSTEERNVVLCLWRSRSSSLP